jgi:hypothetical protein
VADSLSTCFGPPNVVIEIGNGFRKPSADAAEGAPVPFLRSKDRPGRDQHACRGSGAPQLTDAGDPAATRVGLMSSRLERVDSMVLGIRLRGQLRRVRGPGPHAGSEACLSRG